MSHNINGRDWDWGSGPGGGLGTKHGPLGSPAEDCGYSADPNGGASLKGGDPTGKWAQFKETPNQLMGVSRDGLASSPTAAGAIETPMNTSTAMPMGSGKSDGTGPQNGANISSPWTGPFGNTVK